MEYKNLIDDTQIPVLGLGTWLIGGGIEADHSDDNKSIKAIQAAMRLDYTHIDTTKMYSAGHSEELN